MQNYFSTFIPGTGQIIERALHETFPDVIVRQLDDGLVVYATDATPGDIKQLRIFNNSFILAKSFEKLGNNPIKTMANQAIMDRALIRTLSEYTNHKPRSVRVMFYEENEGVNIPAPIREKVEEYIAKDRNLRIYRRDAHVEVWFLTRADGSGFIGVRLTSFPTSERNLEKGQLKPQLAHMLCMLSEPTVFDTVLDPFAGFGSIPFERTYFKYKENIASDFEPSIVQNLTEKAKKQNKKITVIQQDAGSLKQTQDSSIDKIITDPPWGIYEKHIDINVLYEQFLIQANRVLKLNGIMVILTAQKETLEKLISQHAEFTLVEKHDVLVSGKKAGIYKIKKK